MKKALIAIAVLIVAGIAYASVLMASGWRAYVVHTGSMTPHIDSGDLVIDRPAGPVHVGQVITFAKAPGQYVTHRVAAVTPNGIVTKGDANPTDDFGYVTQSQVAGRAAAVIPDAGFAVVFCTHPEGVIGLVMLMGGIGLAWSLLLGKDHLGTDVPLVHK